MSLDIQTKDCVFRNNLLGQFENFIKDELFETLCPGLTNNPSDALDRVAQEVTESLGNVTCLTIHTHFTNSYSVYDWQT